MLNDFLGKVHCLVSEVQVSDKRPFLLYMRVSNHHPTAQTCAPYMDQLKSKVNLEKCPYTPTHLPENFLATSSIILLSVLSFSSI